MTGSRSTNYPFQSKEKPDQPLTLSGTVTDGQTGQPLSGAHVYLYQADANGKYRPGNLVFDSGEYPKPASIFFTNLLYVQDTYFFFADHGGRYGTDIYLETHTGKIFP